MQCWWWYHFQFFPSSAVEIKMKICAHIVPFNPFFFRFLPFCLSLPWSMFVWLQLKEKETASVDLKTEVVSLLKVKSATMRIRCVFIFGSKIFTVRSFIFFFFDYITYSGTIIYYKNVYQRYTRSQNSVFSIRYFTQNISLFRFLQFRGQYNQNI